MIPFFEDLWTRISARLGSNTDSAGTSTVFARLNQIYTGLSSLTKDARIKVFISSGTFTAPKSGYYRVRVQASGGSIADAQISGAGGYCEGEVYLAKNAAVPVSVSSMSGTSASFGSYMSAATGGISDNTFGGSAVGGSATGGSINIAGQSTQSLMGSIAGTGLMAYPRELIHHIGGTPLSVPGVFYSATDSSQAASVSMAVQSTGYGSGGARDSFSGGKSVSARGGIVIIEWME